VVTFLLGSARADVHAPDDNGCSSLHIAALLGDVDIVKKLIKYNANALQTDKLGKKPFDVAHRDCIAVKDLLRKFAKSQSTNQLINKSSSQGGLPTAHDGKGSLSSSAKSHSVQQLASSLKPIPKRKLNADTDEFSEMDFPIVKNGETEGNRAAEGYGPVLFESASSTNTEDAPETRNASSNTGAHPRSGNLPRETAMSTSSKPPAVVVGFVAATSRSARVSPSTVERTPINSTSFRVNSVVPPRPAYSRSASLDSNHSESRGSRLLIQRESDQQFAGPSASKLHASADDQHNFDKVVLTAEVFAAGSANREANYTVSGSESSRSSTLQEPEIKVSFVDATSRRGLLVKSPSVRSVALAAQPPRPEFIRSASLGSERSTNFAFSSNLPRQCVDVRAPSPSVEEICWSPDTTVAADCAERLLDGQTELGIVRGESAPSRIEDTILTLDESCFVGFSFSKNASLDKLADDDSGTGVVTSPRSADSSPLTDSSSPVLTTPSTSTSDSPTPTTPSSASRPRVPPRPDLVFRRSGSHQKQRETDQEEEIFVVPEPLINPSTANRAFFAASERPVNIVDKESVSEAVEPFTSVRLSTDISVPLQSTYAASSDDRVASLKENMCKPPTPKQSLRSAFDGSTTSAAPGYAEPVLLVTTPNAANLPNSVSGFEVPVAAKSTDSVSSIRSSNSSTNSHRNTPINCGDDDSSNESRAPAVSTLTSGLTGTSSLDSYNASLRDTSLLNGIHNGRHLTKGLSAKGISAFEISSLANSQTFTQLDLETNTLVNLIRTSSPGVSAFAITSPKSASLDAYLTYEAGVPTDQRAVPPMETDSIYEPVIIRTHSGKFFGRVDTNTRHSAPKGLPPHSPPISSAFGISSSTSVPQKNSFDPDPQVNKSFVMKSGSQINSSILPGVSAFDKLVPREDHGVVSVTDIAEEQPSNARSLNNESPVFAVLEADVELTANSKQDDVTDKRGLSLVTTSASDDTISALLQNTPIKAAVERGPVPETESIKVNFIPETSRSGVVVEDRTGTTKERPLAPPRPAFLSGKLLEKTVVTSQNLSEKSDSIPGEVSEVHGLGTDAISNSSAAGDSDAVDSSSVGRVIYNVIPAASPTAHWLPRKDVESLSTDTGVLGENGSSSSELTDGGSIVSSWTGSQSWSYSSDAHGAQMSYISASEDVLSARGVTSTTAESVLVATECDSDDTGLDGGKPPESEEDIRCPEASSVQLHVQNDVNVASGIGGRGAGNSQLPTVGSSAAAHVNCPNICDPPGTSARNSPGQACELSSTAAAGIPDKDLNLTSSRENPVSPQPKFVNPFDDPRILARVSPSSASTGSASKQFFNAPLETKPSPSPLNPISLTKDFNEIPKLSAVVKSSVKATSGHETPADPSSGPPTTLFRRPVFPPLAVKEDPSIGPGPSQSSLSYSFSGKSATSGMDSSSDAMVTASLSGTSASLDNVDLAGRRINPVIASVSSLGDSNTEVSVKSIDYQASISVSQSADSSDTGGSAVGLKFKSVPNRRGGTSGKETLGAQPVASNVNTSTTRYSMSGTVSADPNSGKIGYKPPAPQQQMTSTAAATAKYVSAAASTLPYIPVAGSADVPFSHRTYEKPVSRQSFGGQYKSNASSGKASFDPAVTTMSPNGSEAYPPTAGVTGRHSVGSSRYDPSVAPTSFAGPVSNPSDKTLQPLKRTSSSYIPSVAPTSFIPTNYGVLPKPVAPTSSVSASSRGTDVELSKRVSVSAYNPKIAPSTFAVPAAAPQTTTTGIEQKKELKWTCQNGKWVRI
jgi:hypothetical protein